MSQPYTNARPSASSSSLDFASATTSTTTLSHYGTTFTNRFKSKKGFSLGDTIRSRSDSTLAATTYAASSSQEAIASVGPRIPSRVSSRENEMALAQDKMGRLHELFAQGLPVKDVEGVLEEFAWRSLLKGVCVRKWCSELKYILDQFPPSRTALSTLQLPHICLLYPFLTSSPLTSAYNNAYPAPLVAVTYLQCLTRDMTVDALLNVDSADDNASARVMELCIEYIGHIWRSAWSRGNLGGVLADMLSKELADLDKEVFQLIRDPYLRAFLKPLIQRIRFHLGLVSSTQLVSYFPAPTPGRRVPAGQTLTDAYYISTAFARRRLNAGVPVQSVVDDLYFIRDRVPTQELANHVEKVMEHMGIEGRAVEVTTPPSVYMYLPEEDPVDVKEKKVKKKDNRKSAFAFLSGKKSPRSSPTPSSPGMRSAKSPLGNSLDLPPGFNSDRRPSLPGLPMNRTSPALKSPSMTNVLYPFRTTRSTASLMSEQDGDAAELLSNIMAFGEKSDVGLILNDYLLEKRYLLHIHTNGIGDWYLGSGKENAAMIIDAMDAKLVGKKDVMSLASTFVSLRAAYALPDMSVEQQQAEKGLAKQWKKDQDKRASFNASLHNVQMLQDAIAAHEYLNGNRIGTPSSGSEKSKKFKLVPVLEALYTDESAANSDAETEATETEMDTETEIGPDEMATEVESTTGSDDGDETEREESQDVLAMLEVPDPTPPERRQSSTNSRRMSTLSGSRSEHRHSVVSTYAFSIKEATKQLYHPAQAVALELRRADSAAGSESGSSRDDYMGGRIRSSSRSSVSTFDARPSSSTGHYPSESHMVYPVPPPNRNAPGRHRSLRGKPSHSSVHSRLTLGTSRSDPFKTELHAPDSPLPEDHPGARPRSTDSDHSLFSALSLETRLTGEALALMQSANAETSRVTSGPISSADASALAARKDKRKSMILIEAESNHSGSEGDAEDDYTPHASVVNLASGDIPRKVSNNSLAPSGTGSGSSGTLSHSSSSATSATRPARGAYGSEVDKTGINRARDGLPLAGLLSLFTDVLTRRTRGSEGPEGSRQLEHQVEKAVRDFVDGEKRFAQQNGGWDAEDMRRVVWLLRQVAALIDDPILQYPINREIFHLTQSSASTNSSPRTVASSSRSSFSMSTPSLLLPEQQNPGLGLGLGAVGRLRQVGPVSASSINLGMPPPSNNSRNRLSPIPSLPSSRSHSSLSLYSTETAEQADVENHGRPQVTTNVTDDTETSPSMTHVQTPRTADTSKTIREQQRRASIKLAINTDSVRSKTINLDSEDESERRTSRKTSVTSIASDGGSLSPDKREQSPVKFDAPWGRSRPSSPMTASPGESPRASPLPGQLGLFEAKTKNDQWGASYAPPGGGVKRHDSFASVRTFGRPGEVVPGGKPFSADPVFSQDRSESPHKPNSNRGSRDGDASALWDLRQALEASSKTADDAAGKVARVSFLAPGVGAHARAQLDAEARLTKAKLGLGGDAKRARRLSGWI